MELFTPHPRKKIVVVGVVWLALCAISMLAIAQTTAPSPPETNPAKQSAANMRSIGWAIGMYATENRGYLPTDLSQVERYFGNKEAAVKVFRNPRTGAENGYEYVLHGERISKLKQPATVPMAYELDPQGERVKDGIVLFADGHVEGPPLKR
jgi:prepilin-type processing-associated H-X9-DG protein